MSNSNSGISLSGVTVGLTDTNIPSVEAYGDVPYSAPALNVNKDELLHNTKGNKEDNLIDGIPVDNSKQESTNSITSHMKNSQDVLGFESSNKERSSRTEKEIRSHNKL
ncbi:MAG: hypothetical protein Q4F66_11750 [Clostridium sp.]|nr:hypothetical protein [Clostridium sp.]